MRRTLAGIVTTVLIATGMLATAPTADARPRYHPWGSTKAPNQTLRDGCHRYVFRYHVDPPTREWAAEIFISNRRGRAIGSAAVDAASDPARGRLRFEVCRASTVYGRHKIRMKVTYQTFWENHAGWVRPSYFYLRNPRRR